MGIYWCCSQNTSIDYSVTTIIHDRQISPTVIKTPSLTFTEECDQEIQDILGT
jgi:hypothetical protein